MPRPMAELILSVDERPTLKTWASRPRSTRRLATCARIVLACAEGADNQAVAARLGVCSATVGAWRGRFVERRPDGLADEPRPGAPRTITDADVERVVTRALETKPKAATHRSTRGLAGAEGLSQSSVGRIWRAFGLESHRTKSFKLRREEPGAGPRSHPAILADDAGHRRAAHA